MSMTVQQLIGNLLLTANLEDTVKITGGAGNEDACEIGEIDTIDDGAPEDTILIKAE